MSVRQPPVTEKAIRVLLEAIVDYSGLFPPAAVSMPIAVRNYAHYRASGNAWMLGRFVCPVNAFDEFSQVADAFLPRDAGAIPWRITAVGSGDAESDSARIAEFNTRHRVCFDESGAIVDVYEAKASTATEIVKLDEALPRELTTYVEIPVREDPAALIEVIGATGRRAKVRTGGMSQELFPSSAALVRFLSSCIHQGVVCKATAGLHHPLRGDYRLTYEENAASGRMFGYLNVFLAASLLAAGGRESDAIALIEESNIRNIEFNDLQVGWRGPESPYVLDRELIARVRANVITSFGSCSFTEPVDEGRELGLF